MLNKSDSTWNPGLTNEFHARLFRPSITLLVIACDAGTDKIIPTVFPTLCSGYNMIHRHRTLDGSTVLTGVIISFYHIPSGEDNPLPWNVDK